MNCRSFNVLAAVSLVLCLATPFFVGPDVYTNPYPFIFYRLYVFGWTFHPPTVVLLGVPLAIMGGFMILPILWVVRQWRDRHDPPGFPIMGMSQKSEDDVAGE